MRISDWSSDVCSSDLDGPGAKGVSSHVRVILIWAGSGARLNARPRHHSCKDNRNPCGPRWVGGRSAAVPPAAGRVFFCTFLQPERTRVGLGQRELVVLDLGVRLFLTKTQLVYH